MMNGRGSDTDLLGEVQWPKTCQGSVENSGHSEHLRGWGCPLTVSWGSASPERTALPARGVTAALGDTLRFEGLSRCRFAGETQSSTTRTSHMLVGRCELLGGHPLRVRECQPEARREQGLSVRAGIQPPRTFVCEQLFAGPKRWWGDEPWGYYPPPSQRFIVCFKALTCRQSFPSF